MRADIQSKWEKKKKKFNMITKYETLEQNEIT